MQPLRRRLAAAVEQRAQERAGEIVVPEVNLDGIESGLDRQPGRVGVRLGDLADVLA